LCSGSRCRVVMSIRYWFVLLRHCARLYCLRRYINIIIFIKRIPRTRPGQIFPIFASIPSVDPSAARTLGQYACIYILSSEFPPHPPTTVPAIACTHIAVRVSFGPLRIPFGAAALQRATSSCRVYRVGDHLGIACNIQEEIEQGYIYIYIILHLQSYWTRVYPIIIG
jgi:hypothetical protein